MYCTFTTHIPQPHLVHTHVFSRQVGSTTLARFVPAPGAMPDGADPTAPITFTLQYFQDTSLLQQASLGTCGGSSPSRRLQALGGDEDGVLSDGILGDGMSVGASLAAFDSPQMLSGAVAVPTAGNVTLALGAPLQGRAVSCWTVPSVGAEAFTDATVVPDGTQATCEATAVGTVQVPLKLPTRVQYCWYPNTKLLGCLARVLTPTPPQAFAYGAAVAPAPSPATPLPVSSPSPAVHAPAPAPAPPAAADTTQPPAGRPTVRFTAPLPNETPETFSAADKAAYVAALQLAAQAPVDVYILSITRGSVVLDTSVVFAQGAAESARRLSDNLSERPGSVFPASTYGQVSVSGLTTSNASKVPVGAIVGGVVGGVAGLALLGGVVAWLVVRSRRARANSALGAPLSQAA